MLMEIVGCKCSIKTDDEEYLTGSPDIPCRVVGADGEWLRVAYVDGRGNRLQRLSHIEYVTDVTIFEE